MVSELFRLQLCRNDDHNLSQSAAIKYLHSNVAAQGANSTGAVSLSMTKSKIISDIHNREEDRVARENQILKEMGQSAETVQTMLVTPSVRKHLAKFVKKMLMISQADTAQSRQLKQQFLVQQYPAYLHLAQIMEERTEGEKSKFGKVSLLDAKQGKSNL